MTLLDESKKIDTLYSAYNQAFDAHLRASACAIGYEDLDRLDYDTTMQAVEKMKESAGLSPIESAAFDFCASIASDIKTRIRSEVSKAFTPGTSACAAAFILHEKSAFLNLFEKYMSGADKK